MKWIEYTTLALDVVLVDGRSKPSDDAYFYLNMAISCHDNDELMLDIDKCSIAKRPSAAK